MGILDNLDKDSEDLDKSINTDTDKKDINKDDCDEKASNTNSQSELIQCILNTVSEPIIEFIKAKYRQDHKGQLYFFIIVLAIVIAISFLAYTDKLSSELTGTLLASIIGYAVGKYGQAKNNGRAYD